MRPLVEPPIACSTTCAFLNACGVNNSLGLGPLALAISAATLPLASASRNRSAWGAGMVALIGSDSPSDSVMQAMVEAVPITMQVPTDGARRALTASISASSISPARCLPTTYGSRCRRPALHRGDDRPPSDQRE